MESVDSSFDDVTTHDDVTMHSSFDDVTMHVFDDVMSQLLFLLNVDITLQQFVCIFVI